MPNKIESTSSGNDRYLRRDFCAATQVDKYGNKIVKDNAGNKRLSAKEDGKELNFEYQKKYNLNVGKDEFGNNHVSASVLDDAFIATLAEKTKGLLSGKKVNVMKTLPNGDESFVSEEMELSEESIKNLQSIVDKYNFYIDREEPYQYPKNITLKELVSKNIEDFDDEELTFVETIAQSMEIDIENLLNSIKGSPEVSKFLCIECGESMQITDNFCKNCGNKKNQACGNCNQEIHDNSNFCANCGDKLR